MISSSLRKSNNDMLHVPFSEEEVKIVSGSNSDGAPRHVCLLCLTRNFGTSLRKM